MSNFQVDASLMSALTDGSETAGHVKAGFLGFPKSGKSFTAALLACAVRSHFNLKGPISMFDTETGSLYLKPLVKACTGEDLLARRARSFEHLMRWGEACVKAGVSVAIVDSVTHPWRELCDSYLAQINRYRQSKGWSLAKRLEFQDWNTIKPKWARWTDFYLNSPLHIIICGRAGWEYEMEDRDDGSGKKDLVKSGVKMKTEGEFGFEPSLLVEMQRTQDLKDGHRIIRTATVLGDRFSVIDGKEGVFPSTDNHPQALEVVYRFFKPHLDCLTPGAHATVDTKHETDFAINEDGDNGWEAEKKQRTIQCEEIQGELLKRWPSQSAADKKAKVEAIEAVFGTRSWTKVENMHSTRLKEGLAALREKYKTAADLEPVQEKEVTNE